MILNEIIRHKKKELCERKRIMPLAELKKMVRSMPPPKDFKKAISSKRGIRIIGEIKRASPSAGIICREFNPVRIASIYRDSGISAISVLTDEKYFKTSLFHLLFVRHEVSLPILRKDFIIDEYQIPESRAFGADAILLIASILSERELKNLLAASHRIGMQCLIEAHTRRDLEKTLVAGAEIIGINNRDLKTFKTDIRTTANLRGMIPDGKIVVSESGIRKKKDLRLLSSLSVNAALIGESFLRERDIGRKIRDLQA